MEKQLEHCNWSSVFIPSINWYCSGYDHILASIGAAMIGRYGCAMLCHNTQKRTPYPTRRKDGRLPYKLRSSRCWFSQPQVPKYRGDKCPWATNLPGRLDLILSLDPDTAREILDETRPLKELKKHFMYANLCSMKISQENRDVASQKKDGKAKLWEEFIRTRESISSRWTSPNNLEETT
jgi:phosphomethylpyrimidine synthase